MLKRITYFNISLLQIVYSLLSIIICQYRFTPLSIHCWTLSNLIAKSLQFFIMPNDQMMTYHMCLLCTDDIDTSIYLLTHVGIYHLLLGRHSSFRYIPPLLLIAVVFGCVCCVVLCCRVDSTICSHNICIIKWHIICSYLQIIAISTSSPLLLFWILLCRANVRWVE